jgi:hypothetical protein
MNTAKLARTTFVLDRETHDQLAYISRRMGVSRSELVRDVLAEPVALMAKWALSLPDKPTPEDAARVGEVMQLDIVELIERKAEEVRQVEASE